MSRTVSPEVARLARVRQLAATGEAIAIRKRARVSATAVAAAVGVSHVSLLRWEKGVRAPSGDAALRYLELLELLGAIGQAP